MKRKVVVRYKNKECPGVLLDCPDGDLIESEDGTSAEASSLKSKEDAVKKQAMEVKKEKAIMAIKRANQRLRDLSSGK